MSRQPRGRQRAPEICRIAVMHDHLLHFFDEVERRWRARSRGGALPTPRKSERVIWIRRLREMPSLLDSPTMDYCVMCFRATIHLPTSAIESTNPMY
jgi:hypothetical protein